MTINTIGMLAALTTLITIAFGHVMVRELEFRLASLRPAIFTCVILGIGFMMAALVVETNSFSAIFGILGITFLWDALEFYRQQKRVIKGHAPANPGNPRHQKYLSQYPSATIVNLTGREPRGYPFTDEEINSILNPLTQQGENSQ
ncbi:MAG TPA: DUF4491 family protein [Anaerolineaceae bacterium]|nr:DUF4491 family protein [Anaerolineaceae bacterium]